MTTHPQSTVEAMTSRAKELLVQILAAEWSVEKHSLWINADGVPKGPMHAADVRGWGFLTGRGHAHALDSESAFLIQKAIAHNIVDSHNAYRTLSSENARLSERVKVLEAAAKALVSKLDQINDDPAFVGVFQMASIHGAPYSGPSWVAELDAIRAAIKSTDPL